MQELRFIVKGQMIKKDPSSPFSKMVAGTSNYYVAAFDMDSAWTGYNCLAKFETKDSTEFVPIKSGQAMIPESVLKHKNFSVSVIGKNGVSMLTTTTNKVVQIGGI